MDAALRELLRRRAGDQCEYCRVPQEATPLIPFHVEHIIAKQHGGSDEADNLALACDRCNAYKGPNLTSIDPKTDQVDVVHACVPVSAHEEVTVAALEADKFVICEKPMTGYCGDGTDDRQPLGGGHNFNDLQRLRFGAAAWRGGPNSDVRIKDENRLAADIQKIEEP